MATKRRHCFFSGTVQGVGFRAVTHRIALGYPVTGFVRNLPDGRVEMVVEGSSTDIESVLQEIREEMGGYLSQVDTRELLATGEYSTFSITK